jgi:5,10-methylenetetrahydrofolate reductase
LRLGEAARQRRLVTAEVIPDRVVQNELEQLRGRVDAITIPALTNHSADPSYPTTFRVTPQQRSVASALIVRRIGLEAVATLTCRDCTVGELSGVLESRKGSLENFLVVYGDPFPGDRRGTYEFSRSEYLIRKLSQTYGSEGPSIGAITNQHTKDQENEVAKTLAKVDAGADFVITNIALDAENVLPHRDALLSAGLNVPLLIQVSIPHSLNNLLYVTKRFGIKVPERARRKLESGSRGAGIYLAAEAYEGLRREASGIHLSYLFRKKSPVPTYRRLFDTLEIGVRAWTTVSTGASASEDTRGHVRPEL